ncbi:hypothetical protein DRZ77_03465, partial [Candidatus Woesearchaeota archaeon]
MHSEKVWAEEAAEEGHITIYKGNTPLGVYHIDTILSTTDSKIVFEKLGIKDKHQQVQIKDAARAVKKELRKKEKEKKEKIEECAYLILENRPVELIYREDEKKLYFICFDEDGKLVQKSAIQIGEKIYVPPKSDLVKLGAVLIPQGVANYESEEKLLQEIQAFIHKYVDVSEDFEIFASYYVLLSYVYDRFNSIVYLRFLGDFGTGKSRALDVIGKLCYRPIILSGTVTPAPIYRLQGLYKGTLLIDEGDLKKSDATNDIIKILTCGFEKGKPVLRCDKNNPN